MKTTGIEVIHEITAGGFVLHQTKKKPKKFWLQNKIGEGMEVTEEMVERMLTEFFHDNF